MKEKNSIAGVSGSAKSSAVTKLALDWAQGQESRDVHNDQPTNTRADIFEFAFLIQLKHVDQDRPLEKEIIQQYGLQEVNATEKEVGFILEHVETLLIFDGYDEYQDGTNPAIDTKIRDIIRDIITSRPDHMPKKYKSKMDEIQLKGFSKTAIENCTENYLDREGQSRKSEKFLQKAKDNGIKDLLKIPLLLLMLCVIFIETKTLPSNKTGIIKKLIEIYIARAEQKGKEFKNKDQMLRDLGELSYKASTGKPRKKRLFIKKVSSLFAKFKRNHQSITSRRH